MSWRQVELKDVCCNIQYGYTASADENEVGPKFLRITDIVNPVIDWDTVPFCVIDSDSVPKYSIKKGDIVVARTGNTTGYAKLIRREVYAVFASYLIRFQVDPQVADPTFIGLLVESDIFKSYVSQVKGGTAQGGANATTLSKFSFALPALPTQRRIASILSAYDDLIENNLRRIKLLEEAAQHIYREWFVRMRFPGWEGVRLGEDGLPEGWRKEEIGMVADVNLASIKTTNAPSVIKYIDISSTYTGYFDQPTEFEFSLAPSRARRILKHGDTIFSTVRPNRKIYALVLEPDENLIASTGFAVITPKRIKDYPFIYQSVCNDDFVRRATALATGAAYPAINQSEFQKILILKPSGKHIDEYFECCDPIFRQREILLRQNIRLKEARDILLPRLMNQTIEI